MRYPDVSVLCGTSNDPEKDKSKMFDDPKVIIEILSESTRTLDEGIKLQEYQAMASVDTILLIDPAIERIRVLQRLSATSWRDERFPEPADIELPVLGVMLPHAEVFAKD